eukprot:TRINITY_DN25472_c3_g1_i1.p1 TRINITY_DN25472_c3_g1~~TRINITY_DN25472_c3_g1_i1.p1  ORF type:complete len:717 (+),score=235.51 TRINITY_DN25472_c3_g1_i1:78-2228(+)
MATAEGEAERAEWLRQLADSIAVSADTDGSEGEAPEVTVVRTLRHLAAERAVIADLACCPPQRDGLQPLEALPWFFEGHIQSLDETLRCTDPCAEPFHCPPRPEGQQEAIAVSGSALTFDELRRRPCVTALLGPPRPRPPPRKPPCGAKRPSEGGSSPAKVPRQQPPYGHPGDARVAPPAPYNPGAPAPLRAPPQQRPWDSDPGGRPQGQPRSPWEPQGDAFGGGQQQMRRGGFGDGFTRRPAPAAPAAAAPLGTLYDSPASQCDAGGGFGPRPGAPPSWQPARDLREPPPAGGGAARREGGFVTAAHQLDVEQARRPRGPGGGPPPCGPGNGGDASRGSNPRMPGRQRFIPPFRDRGRDDGSRGGGGQKKKDGEEAEKKVPECLLNADGSVPERLKNIEVPLLESICNEVLDHGLVRWDDIVGLEHAKAAVNEAIVWPLQRPDLFQGLRGPAKGLLLFGPPGTGKTMIGKAIASESQSTFFNISSSSLMSKWVGEGEKMVRALFACASVRQPAVVFIDEIDSLLTMRSDGEQDHTRRLKTEFLVQLDGAGTDASDRILIVGATNRPQELDEAARRRMEKRLYIPLPNSAARRALVAHLLKGERHELSETDIEKVAKKTEGYSGADMRIVCREACMVALRQANIGSSLMEVDKSQVRGVKLTDFANALRNTKPTVSASDIEQHEAFDAQFGSFSRRAAAQEEDAAEADAHFFDDCS